MRQPVVIVLLTMLFVAIASPSFAQNDGIKKSKKTEIVEGKKYYLHTVEKGQTLYAIAKAYDLTVNDILVENPDALNGIKPGQVLRIPAQKPAPVTKPAAASKDTGFFIHTVEPGQTLYSICKTYNVKEEAVLALNPEAKNGLKVGQSLKIPGKKPGQPAAAITRPVQNPADTLFQLNRKPVYNVALMLPFQLANADAIDPDDQDKNPIPPKVDAAVEFYEGALLAVDSMRRRGMKVNLHVYDMDEGDSARVQSVLAKPEFATMDLIIGPLSPGPCYVASQWAREHHVAIVSPVSPVNRVLFKRPDAAKALPSTSTQMEQLAIYIATAHKTDNVVVVSSGNAKEEASANTFRMNANKLLFPSGNDSIGHSRGMAGLQAQLRTDRTNVLIIPTNSQAFVTDLLRMLNGLTEKYPIIVYGLSSWMGYDNLDPEYLQNLQMHFVAPYFVDYDSSTVTKRFVRSYSDAFHGDPGSFAFAGYDVTFFFLESLYLNGTNFYQKLPQTKGSGLQQDFDFFRSDAESGYENKAIRIMQVKDYRIVRVK
jgi:LysM repeat protein